MMVKKKPKKAKPRKSDLISSITELFSDQGKKVNQNISELFEHQSVQIDKKFNTMKGELKTEIVFELKILIDNDERMNAFSDPAKVVELQNSKIEHHEQRVEYLEKDVKVLKSVLKN
jgi:hypothetical protein